MKFSIEIVTRRSPGDLPRYSLETFRSVAELYERVATLEAQGLLVDRPAI